MTILDSFKKLAKAWGIEPKGDNIADAVNNVVENIPFGVKTEMVEIVPEQSMTVVDTFEGLNVYNVEFFEIIVGKKYETIFNNVKYECTATASSDGNPGYIGNAHHIGGPDTGEPFVIVTDGDGNIGCLCKSELGETITLAIYEEQEIVKPLDSKFIGGADMVIMINGNPTSPITIENTSVISGSVEKVLDAFSEGRQPNVKIMYNKDEYAVDIYSVLVHAYGEDIELSFMLAGFNGFVYSRYIYIRNGNVIDVLNNYRGEFTAEE